MNISSLKSLDLLIYLLNIAFINLRFDRKELNQCTPG